MCQLVKVSTDPRQPLHPVPIMSSVQPTTMINVTFTAEQIAVFTEALERAVDCPFMDDDASTDLVLNQLLGKLEGAADAAKVA